MMASDIFCCLLFPVVRHQGYRQRPEDLPGGTGCFVILASLKARGLPELKTTQPNTVLPKVEFSLKDSCFFSSPPPIMLDEEEVDVLTPDFFACLSTFVETDDASTLWCVGGDGNDDSLSSLRPFLCSLRHCVVLDKSLDEASGEKTSFKTEEVLVEATALLSHTSLPKNVEGVRNILPLNGDTQSKLSRARFYDGLVQSKLMDSKDGFRSVSDALFEKVPEDRRKAEQRLANLYLRTLGPNDDGSDDEGTENASNRTLRSLRHHLLPQTWMDPKLMTLGEVEKKVTEKKEVKKKVAGKKRKREEEGSDKEERPRKKAKKQEVLEKSAQESMEEGSIEEKSE